MQGNLSTFQILKAISHKFNISLSNLQHFPLITNLWYFTTQFLIHSPLCICGFRIKPFQFVYSFIFYYALVLKANFFHNLYTTSIFCPFYLNAIFLEIINLIENNHNLRQIVTRIGYGKTISGDLNKVLTRLIYFKNINSASSGQQNSTQLSSEENGKIRGREHGFLCDNCWYSLIWMESWFSRWNLVVQSC